MKLSHHKGIGLLALERGEDNSDLLNLMIIYTNADCITSCFGHVSLNTWISFFTHLSVGVYNGEDDLNTDCLLVVSNLGKGRPLSRPGPSRVRKS